MLFLSFYSVVVVVPDPVCWVLADFIVVSFIILVFSFIDVVPFVFGIYVVVDDGVIAAIVVDVIIVIVLVVGVVHNLTFSFCLCC